MSEKFVLGWMEKGHRLIVQEAFSNCPRYFTDKEEAETVAAELSKGFKVEVSIIPVVDPPGN